MSSYSSSYMQWRGLGSTSSSLGSSFSTTASTTSHTRRETSSISSPKISSLQSKFGELGEKSDSLSFSTRGRSSAEKNARLSSKPGETSSGDTEKTTSKIKPLTRTSTGFSSNALNHVDYGASTSLSGAREALSLNFSISPIGGSSSVASSSKFRATTENSAGNGKFDSSKIGSSKTNTPSASTAIKLSDEASKKAEKSLGSKYGEDTKTFSTGATRTGASGAGGTTKGLYTSLKSLSSEKDSELGGSLSKLSNNLGISNSSNCSVSMGSSKYNALGSSSTYRPLENLSSASSTFRSRFSNRSTTTNPASAYSPYSTFTTSLPLNEEPPKKSWRDRYPQQDKHVSAEPTSWMSRGTSTEYTDRECKNEEISKDEAPSVNPKKFDGVTKTKGTQTDKEKIALLDMSTANKYLSSIPRPTQIAMSNLYSQYGSAISRYSKKLKDGEGKEQAGSTNESDASGKIANGAAKRGSIKRTGSIGKEKKQTDARDDQSKSVKDAKGSVSNEKNSTDNDGVELHNKCESSKILKRDDVPVTRSGSTISLDKKSEKTSATNQKVELGAGASANSANFKITLMNKQFRKSALNVELRSKEEEEEFSKKQEQLRTITNENEKYKNTNQSTYNGIVETFTVKLKRKPPATSDKVIPKAGSPGLGRESRSRSSSITKPSGCPSPRVLRRSSHSPSPSLLAKSSSKSNLECNRKLSDASNNSDLSLSDPLVDNNYSIKSKIKMKDNFQPSRKGSSNLESENVSRKSSATSLSSFSSTSAFGSGLETSASLKNMVKGDSIQRKYSVKKPKVKSHDLASGLSESKTTEPKKKMKKSMEEKNTKKSNICSAKSGNSYETLDFTLEKRTSPDGGEVLSTEFVSNLTELGKMNSFGPSPKGFFIGNMTNIDDILGQLTSPSLPLEKDPLLQEIKRFEEVVNEDKHCNESLQISSDSEDEENKNTTRNDASDDDDNSIGSTSSFEEVDPSSLHGFDNIPADSAAVSKASSKEAGSKNSLSTKQSTGVGKLKPSQKLDDATLQIYKDGDYGQYLDLEATIAEQSEDFLGFKNNRKNSVILRAQLPVRVHAIIEKLLNADGRELRRALFSLKQIFQEDKDLVHEFVQNGGLSCLIKVGSEADQNYQNYILRAIGQVMLYVDGMHGVMRHNETVQWLYSLVASKYRLVQKTALKLLLVFVDYVESNCILLVKAIAAVDSMKGAQLWSNMMNLLREHDSSSGDTELLVYAMSLVNKVLNGIPDIDAYFDQVDALEEQGMASLIQKYMGKQCADLDLLKQFQIYEVVLKHEDGIEDNLTLQLDEKMRQKLMNRRGCGVEFNEHGVGKERRKSRRHSANGVITPSIGSTAPPTYPHHPTVRRLSSTDENRKELADDSSSGCSSTASSAPGTPVIPNGFSTEKCNIEVGVTPGLRRRRERAERQKYLQIDQQLSNTSLTDINGHSDDLKPPSSPFGDKSSFEYQNNLKNCVNNASPRPWILPIYSQVNGKEDDDDSNLHDEIDDESVDEESGDEDEDGMRKGILNKRENTVKNLTQKLTSQSLIPSPVDESKCALRSEELSGVVLKAKEGLAKSKSRADVKVNNQGGDYSANVNKPESPKKSDNELHWDYLVNNLQRSLEICDLDFQDLKASDDEDILDNETNSHEYTHCNSNSFYSLNGYPPPPPDKLPPPPMNGFLGKCPPAPPVFGITLKHQQNGNDCNEYKTYTKSKKTVKLFWKEVRDDPVTEKKKKKVGCLWQELNLVPIDEERFEFLFESKAKDLMNKKQGDANKNKEILVLDPKRSNAINIGMTKLPPPRTIKTAIMKMDSTIINREGIEKILSMLPTEEERAKIQEAQFANPEIPLGNAEQFLLTLSSISELTARLKIWAFKLDYENLEREVAEPLMDLKQGIEVLEKNKTFRNILAILLSIGNFLNGSEAKGFQIEYLSKVPEVKDTVHKHSLLHHLCHTVNENFPESSDLYSEIGPVTRASRVDFDEIETNLKKMESECKSSWDHLRVISKHDGPTNLKLKMSEFLADSAERIIVLGIIHRRVMNRYHKFLIWLGVPAHQIITTKPHLLFKTISEFALEYRTTRDRVIQQIQKKENYRERNKTRGKMITEQRSFNSKEDKADAELRNVLNNPVADNNEEVVCGTLTWGRRTKGSMNSLNSTTLNSPTTYKNNLRNCQKSATLDGKAKADGDGDDEILESLVKTATRAAETRTAPRERKRNSSRLNNDLRRTLRHGLSEEERKMLAAFMATGHNFVN